MRLIGADELEAERAHPPSPAILDRVTLGAGHPQGWVRLLHRLRDDVAWRQIEVLPVVLGAALTEHRDDRLHRLFPHLALVPEATAERVQLCRARRLTNAELDAAVAQQVES